MAAQIQPDVDSIEHLDHEVMCEGRCHAGPPARADFHCDQHGCAGFLLCTACVENDVDLAAGHTGFACDFCGMTAATLRDLVTVVPL